MGYEPTREEITWRRKLMYLLRMVPMVERNYNLIELGPKETGKSFVFREISPYAMLLPGDVRTGAAGRRRTGGSDQAHDRGKCRTRAVCFPRL